MVNGKAVMKNSCSVFCLSALLLFAQTNSNLLYADAGKAAYDMACKMCHSMGLAGAPKIGDAGAWVDRISKGMEVLNDHAINGYSGSTGVCPAKGGNMSLSDDDATNAVLYMVKASQASENVAPVEQVAAVADDQIPGFGAFRFDMSFYDELGPLAEQKCRSVNIDRSLGTIAGKGCTEIMGLETNIVIRLDFQGETQIDVYFPEQPDQFMQKVKSALEERYQYEGRFEKFHLPGLPAHIFANGQIDLQEQYKNLKSREGGGKVAVVSYRPISDYTKKMMSSIQEAKEAENFKPEKGGF